MKSTNQSSKCQNQISHYQMKHGLIVCLIVCTGTVATASQEFDQNEAVDAIVRFGEYRENRKKVQAEVRTLSPIDDQSYESMTNPNRAPASVGDSARGPAGSSSTEPAAVVQLASDRQLPASTLVRNLKNRKAVQEVSVIVTDLGFFPSTLFVTQGIPVRLYVTGASKKSQCIMMDAFGVRRQIQNQKIEEITFTPEESGTFAFSCPMNGARGALLVKELEVGRMPANVKLEALNQTDEE
jgi:hypothetical protein